MLLATSWYEWEQVLELAPHGEQPPRAAVSRRSDDEHPGWSFRPSSAGGVIAMSLLTLGVLAYSVFATDDGPADPAPGALATSQLPASRLATPRLASPQAVAEPAATPVDEVRTPGVRAPAPVPPTAASVPADDRGFVASTARCNGSDAAVAIGQTKRSLIVVCRIANGRLEYHGVRLSDGAKLHLTDVSATPTGFIARNDGSSYRVSSKELVVTTGDSVTNQDAMIDYRVPPARS